MTGKQIVDMCGRIIKRQDLDKDLLLMFINQQRHMVFRSTYLHKIQSWKRNFEPEDGFVTTGDRLKQARYVEWNPNPADNAIVSESVRKKKLFRLNTINEAYEIYDDVDALGEPVHYIVMEDGIKIIPVPVVGVIDIFGEWYPADIKEDDTEDTLDKEVSDAIVYLGCAEYFDFLMETDKGNLWRQKAGSMLSEYFKEIKRQMTDDKELFARDPFGNLGIIHGTRREQGHLYDIDEVTGGTKGDIFDGGEN
jgi:hypothetical protein